MAKRKGEPKGDRIASILLSVLVHAALVAALLWGWWQYRKPKHVPQTLAIQATVVERVTHPDAAPKAPAPRPAPPAPPDVQLTPDAAPPTPAQLPQPNDAPLKAQLAAEAAAQKAAQAKAAADKAAAAKAAAERLAAAHEAAEKAAAQKAAAAKAAALKVAAEKAAAEKAAAEKAAAEKAQREAKLAAERKAQEQAALKAKQEAERESKLLAAQLANEQAERQREADLRSQMQAEERLDALRSGPEEQTYVNMISSRISRAWIKPPGWQAGETCVVHLTQIPGGEVTHVNVENCKGGDEAARLSVQNAVYRASPLPAPPDPALFDPNITVTFAPEQ